MAAAFCSSKVSNGSDSDFLVLMTLTVKGRIAHADAIAYANRALRQSPFYPVAFAAHGAFGHVAFQEARFDKAASCYASAVQANPRFSVYYFLQAVALPLAGRADEAKRIVGKSLELFPGVRNGEIKEYTFLHPAVMDKFIEGARLLGLPE